MNHNKQIGEIVSRTVVSQGKKHGFITKEIVTICYAGSIKGKAKYSSVTTHELFPSK